MVSKKRYPSWPGYTVRKEQDEQESLRLAREELKRALGREKALTELKIEAHKQRLAAKWGIDKAQF